MYLSQDGGHRLKVRIIMAMLSISMPEKITESKIRVGALLARIRDGFLFRLSSFFWLSVRLGLNISSIWNFFVDMVDCYFCYTDFIGRRAGFTGLADVSFSILFSFKYSSIITLPFLISFLSPIDDFGSSTISQRSMGKNCLDTK